MSVIYKNHVIDRNYSGLSKKALLTLWADRIGKPFRPRYLLSDSVKVIKGEKIGYLTGVCYMSNAVKIAGVATCSHAVKAGCVEPCLAMSGHMSLAGAVEARADRLSLLIKDTALFFEILSRELKALEKAAKRKRFKVAGRLNGTTDLDWTRITFNGATIFEHFPRITWYDYTKNPKIAQAYSDRGVSVTFSYYKKAATADLLHLLDRGVNIAIAYRDTLPITQSIGGRSVEVINGDLHDLRFLDKKGAIVGLKYKNQTMHKKAAEVNATAHESGFIIFSNSVIN